jgi:hypothetical protein
MRMAYPFRPIRNRINESESDGNRKSNTRLKLIKKRTAVRFPSKQTEPNTAGIQPDRAQ